jgi:hypothetical protein
MADRGMIRTLEIGETRKVHVERCNHWHRLWKVEAEFAPDMDTHDVSLSWDPRRFDATGEVTAGRTPIHNHRSGFFVHSMVNFIQTLFATERMLDSIEGPAQSGRTLNLVI